KCVPRRPPPRQRGAATNRAPPVSTTTCASAAARPRHEQRTGRRRRHAHPAQPAAGAGAGAGHRSRRPAGDLAAAGCGTQGHQLGAAQPVPVPGGRQRRVAQPRPAWPGASRRERHAATGAEPALRAHRLGSWRQRHRRHQPSRAGCGDEHAAGPQRARRRRHPQRAAGQRPGEPDRACAGHAVAAERRRTVQAVDGVPDQLPHLGGVRGGGGADRQPGRGARAAAGAAPRPAGPRRDHHRLHRRGAGCAELPACAGSGAAGRGHRAERPPARCRLHAGALQQPAPGRAGGRGTAARRGRHAARAPGRCDHRPRRRLTLGAGHLHRGPADAVAGAAGAAEQRAAAGAGADHHREPAERAGRRPHAAAHLHAAHPRRPARAAAVRRSRARAAEPRQSRRPASTHRAHLPGHQRDGRHLDRPPARGRRRQHPGGLQRQRTHVRRQPAGGGDMSDYAPWLEANDRYLAAALADLRERLQRAAQRSDEPIAPPPAPPATALMEVAPAVDATTNTPTPKPSWFARLFGGTHAHPTLSTAELDAITPPAPRPIVAAVPAADGTTAALPPATAPEHTPALVLLANRLGLNAFERDLLLLCIGMELDTRFPALCAQAQHDPAKPYPTFALAFAVLDAPSWDALSPERPLRYWRLLEIHQPGPQPLIGAALAADERVVNFVKGLNYLDDRLTPLLTTLPPAALPSSQQALVDQVLETLHHVPPGEPLPVVQLLGSDGTSKQAVAQTIAATFGAQAWRLSAELLPTTAGEQETLLRLWQRESQLLPLALYLD